MIGTKHVGDDVLCLGNVKDLDWIAYVDSDIDPDADMDDMIGKVAAIVEVNKDRFTGPVYKVEGCKWYWAPEWLAEPSGDQLPGQLSIEDFGLVVD